MSYGIETLLWIVGSMIYLVLQRRQTNPYIDLIRRIAQGDADFNAVTNADKLATIQMLAEHADSWTRWYCHDRMLCAGKAACGLAIGFYHVVAYWCYGAAADPGVLLLLLGGIGAMALITYYSAERCAKDITRVNNHLQVTLHLSGA